MSFRFKPSLLIGCLLLALFLTGCNLQRSPLTPMPTNAPEPGETAAVAVPNPTPAAFDTPQAPAADAPRSQGADVRLDPEGCFDLDGGETLAAGQADCDFSFSAVTEEGQTSIHFVPLSAASFAFGSVFWEPPSLQDCLGLKAYSTGSLTVSAAQSFSVCYQTGEGYWGWLTLRGYEQQALLVDWTTFNEQAPLLAAEPLPSETAPAAETYAVGTNQWVRYDQALDLDTSRLRTRFDEGVDFLVASGRFDVNGAVQNVLLKPVSGASFRFAQPLDRPPTPEDCLPRENYGPEEVQVDALRRYICYQTSRGRLGYLYIHEAHPGVGLRLDWATWPQIEDNRVGAQPNAPAAAAPYSAEILPPEEPGGLPVYAPGARFSYTWQIANTGETVWRFNFNLVFADGNQMGSGERVPIRSTIDPGEVLKLTLNLAAPRAFGTFTGLYWLEDTAGVRFGVGPGGTLPLQVLVNVGEPGLTLAEGQAVTLAQGYCYDLDLGYYAQGDPACDFYLEEALDPVLVKFDSPLAAFDFEGLFTEPPPLGQCQAARLASAERLIDLQDWYICYKTNEGRYGWLYLRETGEGRLTFDWKTYR